VQEISGMSGILNDCRDGNSDDSQGTSVQETRKWFLGDDKDNEYCEGKHVD
jgi:hypothetical protein